MVGAHSFNFYLKGFKIMDIKQKNVKRAIDFQNTLHNAYAFLEFNGDFNQYLNTMQEGESIESMFNIWLSIVEDYEKVSIYISDECLENIVELSLNEF